MGANGGRFPVVRSKVIKFDIAHNHVLFQEIQLRAGSTNSHRGCSTEGTERSWFKNNLTHWNISRNFCELMNICNKVHLMQEFKTVLVLSVFCKNNNKKKRLTETIWKVCSLNGGLKAHQYSNHELLQRLLQKQRAHLNGAHVV